MLLCQSKHEENARVTGETATALMLAERYSQSSIRNALNAVLNKLVSLRSVDKPAQAPSTRLKTRFARFLVDAEAKRREKGKSLISWNSRYVYTFMIYYGRERGGGIDRSSYRPARQDTLR